MAPPTKLYRVREGSQVSGVCQGLEVCGKGKAIAYRLLFVFGGLYIVGIVVYVVMAMSTPVATKEDLRGLIEESESEESNPILQSSRLDQLEEKLSKIESMRTQNLITSEEAEKLRAKTLGIL